MLKVFGVSWSFSQFMSVVFLLFYLFGVLNIHFSDSSDYCEMTYMFEYPQFVKISVPERKIHPQYGLYAYSEGRFTERARKMWFDGVPVLFLPGNSGSHMQVRSLASVALRKALDRGYDYHFDYFTVNYNEELSALYGGVLQRQTDFAAACIAKIISLYKDNEYTKSTPSSVIIIGHSMGGTIAKRLLAHPATLNVTAVAVSLAGPLDAPVINTDIAMNDYYLRMHSEWDSLLHDGDPMKSNKVLISIGNGVRDVLVSSALIYSSDSVVNALSTAIPGTWVSPDHVSVVWCKQLVLTINRFLFDLLDPDSEQLTTNIHQQTSKAKQYFQANRTMYLDPKLNRPTVAMLADAFWYEDNRRLYQIFRPEIDKTTYLMIRLVKFPQNRFAAVETINVEDKDWLFGCNAKLTYNTHRYCNYATSLSELSRWTGAAKDFGKRKLATVHLHGILEQYPDWTHVLVKISPTRKPIRLNVDINDHTSRQIHVDVGLHLLLSSVTVVQETEPNSLYYELILNGFRSVHELYLLYVEPSASCTATQYHASAELHVPWADNSENYHYFTHSKRSPMKIRLFKSDPNSTSASEPEARPRVTLLLDPQCTYTVSISSSWYYWVGQLARNYSPILFPYMAAILLVAVRSNLASMRTAGRCLPVHSALATEGFRSCYALVFARLCSTVLITSSLFGFLFENASWHNQELQYFTRSLLVIPTYMVALGMLTVATVAAMLLMVFSSQIAHRLLLRMLWRGGGSVTQNVAAGLRKVPLLVSGGLVVTAPLSCGAASLVLGAAFYAFLISKMYEEYFEDYIYRMMAKVAARICKIFKSKNKNIVHTSVVRASRLSPPMEFGNDKTKDNCKLLNEGKKEVSRDQTSNEDLKSGGEELQDQENTDANTNCKSYADTDEDLNSLNFHMMMFFLWMTVTLVNVPALLTWARNFKYSIVLTPDTSYHAGVAMSVCSAGVWQIRAPRTRLKHYEYVSALVFTMAVFMLSVGPLSFAVVNYGVTFMFTVMTIQQLFDTDEVNDESSCTSQNHPSEPPENVCDQDDTECNHNKGESEKESSTSKNESEVKNDINEENGVKTDEGQPADGCDVCSESRIYNVFQNLNEKLHISDDL